MANALREVSTYKHESKYDRITCNYVGMAWTIPQFRESPKPSQSPPRSGSFILGPGHLFSIFKRVNNNKKFLHFNILYIIKKIKFLIHSTFMIHGACDLALIGLMHGT
jgi:hypothetical protein